MEFKLSKSDFGFNYKDLIIFLIPFTIFMYYLYIYNPGVLTYDSFAQLNQISTSKFNAIHPFFHTFIEMLCLKLYPNTKSVAILQITIFSMMWMIICNYTRSKSSRKQLALQIIITLAISLIPINAIYSITLWKDILFSYFLMFLSFLTYVLIDKDFDVSYGFVFIFCLSIAFVSQLRHNGFYIMIVFLFIIGLYLFKRDKRNKLYLTIPTVAIILILLVGSLNIAYNVDSHQKDMIFSKVSHALADYDLNLDLDKSDADKIHELINETDIKTYYQKTSGDTIYNHIPDKKVYFNDKSTYINMLISYSLKNPVYSIRYILDSAPIVWDITRDDDWKGTVYNLKVDSSKDHFYSSNPNKHPVTNYDNVSLKNQGTDEFNRLDSLVHKVKDSQLLDTLFDSPALYMYLSFVVLGGIYLITKSKDMFLIYLPNMLNILIVFVSIPAQDNRYLYSNLLVFYLLVIIFISILSKNRNYLN